MGRKLNNTRWNPSNHPGQAGKAVFPFPTLAVILLPAHGYTHYPLPVALVSNTPCTFTGIAPGVPRPSTVDGARLAARYGRISHLRRGDALSSKTSGYT
ncbi:MAG TPA: hypothetical protein GXX19_01085 [Syntrophomonadaceae bacterium]|nr:hypothetical protein [Syntrophomonadaceae bacterium]